MLIKTRKSFMFWDSSVNRPREMWLPQLLPSPDEGAAGVRAQLARGGCRRGRGERRGMKGGCLRFGEKTKRMGRLPWPPPKLSLCPTPVCPRSGRKAGEPAGGEKQFCFEKGSKTRPSQQKRGAL